jgi:hypothetical protein
MICHGLILLSVVWYWRFFQEAARYGDSQAGLVLDGTEQLNAQLILDGCAASDEKPYGW